MIRSRKIDGEILTEMDHVHDLITRRKANGKKGIPKAVKRWCRRTGNPVPNLET